MLLPTEVDLILLKKSCKQNLIWPGNSTSGKVILIFLTEIVALYVGPTAVDLQGLGLQFVSRSTFWDMAKRLDDYV